ncbi:S8 family peptidase [Coprococcus sp. AF21-14LB]|uniref:S8 family peptidase n=1 Tax=Coprococcus sp. AF21-14LB TaxID=2292231 RepID=UPI000E51D129|nr:S8 family peptidase [Coprococcus sp. AF21-14LB]RGS76682.1 peptidase S8 [Coprococcus sp. AF21-14LB]
MENQKAEALLNLAADATTEELKKAEELSVGYDEGKGIWEIIIKYSGTLEETKKLAEAVVELQGGFAVVTVKKTNLEALLNLPEIEYAEKPKSLYFEVEEGRRVSCINTVQDAPLSLSGKGVLVAIVDSGIDYRHRDFRNQDGTTRILNLWDQTGTGSPPAGYHIGTEYTKTEIDAVLNSERMTADEEVRGENRVLTVDNSGHGTAVAGIAAGNGSSSEGIYRGAAPQSELLIVKLGQPRENGFPRTTELMQGLDYVIRKALEYRRPVAVNVSFGNTYGSHDGTTLAERFIDSLANIWKTVICVGAGNEAAGAGHTSGVLKAEEEEIVEFAVQDRQPELSIQIWKEYEDEMEISIIAPSGIRVGPIKQVLGSQRFEIERTEILLYYGEPNPYSTAQEVYISFLPETDYIDSGIWGIVLTPVSIVRGAYEMWMPGQQVLNRGTGFLYPTAKTTLTIPSAAANVVTVGAYDSRTFSYADFSGRGYTRITNQIKPDLVAPGVNVRTTRVGGGYVEMTGTSFATPFVTGAAALMMEWGIIRGNDPYLYGEKVKAYLRKGARALPEFEEYPNPYVGFGALCVRESIPE